MHSVSPETNYTTNPEEWLKLKSQIATQSPTLAIAYEGYNYASLITLPDEGNKQVFLVWNFQEQTQGELTGIMAEAIKVMYKINPDFNPEVVKMNMQGDLSKPSYFEYSPNTGIAYTWYTIRSIESEQDVSAKLQAAALHELIHLSKDYEEDQEAMDETLLLAIEYLYPFSNKNFSQVSFEKFHSFEAENQDEGKVKDKYNIGWDEAKRRICKVHGIESPLPVSELDFLLSRLEEKEIVGLMRNLYRKKF